MSSTLTAVYPICVPRSQDGEGEEGYIAEQGGKDGSKQGSSRLAQTESFAEGDVQVSQQAQSAISLFPECMARLLSIKHCAQVHRRLRFMSRCWLANFQVLLRPRSINAESLSPCMLCLLHSEPVPETGGVGDILSLVICLCLPQKGISQTHHLGNLLRLSEMLSSPFSLFDLST